MNSLLPTSLSGLFDIYSREAERSVSLWLNGSPATAHNMIHQHISTDHIYPRYSRFHQQTNKASLLASLFLAKHLIPRIKQGINAFNEDPWKMRSKLISSLTFIGYRQWQMLFMPNFPQPPSSNAVGIIVLESIDRLRQFRQFMQALPHSNHKIPIWKSLRILLFALLLFHSSNTQSQPDWPRIFAFCVAVPKIDDVMDGEQLHSGPRIRASERLETALLTDPQLAECLKILKSAKDESFIQTFQILTIVNEDDWRGRPEMDIPLEKALLLASLRGGTTIVCLELLLHGYSNDICRNLERSFSLGLAVQLIDDLQDCRHDRNIFTDTSTIDGRTKKTIAFLVSNALFHAVFTDTDPKATYFGACMIRLMLYLVNESMLRHSQFYSYLTIQEMLPHLPLPSETILAYPLEAKLERLLHKLSTLSA